MDPERNFKVSLNHVFESFACCTYTLWHIFYICLYNTCVVEKGSLYVYEAYGQDKMQGFV